MRLSLNSWEGKGRVRFLLPEIHPTVHVPIIISTHLPQPMSYILQEDEEAREKSFYDLGHSLGEVRV